MKTSSIFFVTAGNPEGVEADGSPLGRDSSHRAVTMGAGNGIARTSAFPSATWERGEAQATNATVPSAGSGQAATAAT
jgi:hypothetical protein